MTASQVGRAFAASLFGIAVLPTSLALAGTVHVSNCTTEKKYFETYNENDHVDVAAADSANIDSGHTHPLSCSTNQCYICEGHGGDDCAKGNGDITVYDGHQYDWEGPPDPCPPDTAVGKGVTLEPRRAN